MSLLTDRPPCRVLENIKFIVTSGPTREFIDPIRFLSNPSTGRMGYHIGRACINKGYEVCYISGPVPAAFRQVPQANNHRIVSTQDLLDLVLKEVRDDSVLVMAAAPADYRPESRHDHKIKKTQAPSIRLVPNPDILKTVLEHVKKKKLKRVVLVGFAAETRDPEAHALKKLNDKKLDIIFLNDITNQGSGFGVDTNQLTVFRDDGSYDRWENDSKERLGYRIVEEIESLLLKRQKT